MSWPLSILVERGKDEAFKEGNFKQIISVRRSCYGTFLFGEWYSQLSTVYRVKVGCTFAHITRE